MYFFAFHAFYCVCIIAEAIPDEEQAPSDKQHPPKHDPQRVSKYKQYFEELNLTGLSFPLKVSDVPKFERLNTHM